MKQPSTSLTCSRRIQGSWTRVGMHSWSTTWATNDTERSRKWNRTHLRRSECSWTVCWSWQHLTPAGMNVKPMPLDRTLRLIFRLSIISGIYIWSGSCRVGIAVIWVTVCTCLRMPGELWRYASIPLHLPSPRCKVTSTLISELLSLASGRYQLWDQWWMGIATSFLDAFEGCSPIVLNTYEFHSSINTA